MADSKPFPTLTDRERQVALLLAVGVPNRTIADRIKCSIKTVDTHRMHIMKKLELGSNVELAHFAIHHKYVRVIVPQAKAA